MDAQSFRCRACIIQYGGLAGYHFEVKIHEDAVVLTCLECGHAETITFKALWQWQALNTLWWLIPITLSILAVEVVRLYVH